MRADASKLWRKFNFNVVMAVCLCLAATSGLALNAGCSGPPAGCAGPPVVHVDMSKIDGTIARELSSVDALSSLAGQISELPDSAFVNPGSAADARSRIIKEINLDVPLLEYGAYQDAADKLENAVKNGIAQEIVTAQQATLIKGVDVAIAAVVNASKTTITLLDGQLAGAYGGPNCWVYQGVPFAKPPVGELRWHAPVYPEPWKNIRQSTNTFSPATQYENNRQFVPQNKVRGAEDCLYLNIYKPQKFGTNLPVLVWFHGGSLAWGEAKQYNGAYLAGKYNMVVVIVQYRLGPMGFFSHPALNGGGSAEDRSGNFGVLDCVQSLKWVKDNIAACNGCPNNITIAGQSAGGLLVWCMLTTPLAKDLFQHAVVQSSGGNLVTQDTAYQLADDIIEKLLVTDGTVAGSAEAAAYREKMTPQQIESYLRGKNSLDIERAAMNSRGTITLVPPVMDGLVIPGQVVDLVAAGKYNRVPVIVGSNEFETKVYQIIIGALFPTSNGKTWNDGFKVLNGEMNLDAVFPTQADKDYYQTVAKYASLNWKESQVDRRVKVLREKQPEVWCYLFKWGGPGSGPTGFDFLVGPSHAMEIPFFFGGDFDTWGYSFTDQNKMGRLALQDAMSSYLADFAAYGDPNGGGRSLPKWEQWSNEEGGPKCIVFDGDYNKAIISAMNQAYTREGLQAEINTLPQPLPAAIGVFSFFK